MSTAELCEHAAWDSEFFGVRIARVAPGVERLTPDTAGAITAWSERHAIACLYFLAASDDPPTARLAEDHGFRLVDIRVTLERRLADAPAGDAPADVHIRLAHEDDIPALRAIAGASYHDSRFYADPHFSRAQCDALYQTWIEKSCHGYADAVLVAQHDGQAAGFVTCDLPDPAEGQIGLVGVAAAAQGRGLGQALVRASLAWFQAQGARRVTVVTQGRNRGAQRLYQRCGFLTDSVQLWYHRWSPQADSPE